MSKTNAAASEAPISKAHIEAAADAHGVEECELAKMIAEIDLELSGRADVVVHHAKEEMDFDPLFVDGGHFVGIYVEQTEWNNIANQHELSHETKVAAKEAHRQAALKMGADEKRLAAYDALILPAPLVTELQDASLSRRQAQVQSLRMGGATQEEISDELSISLGTVKSHCKRIDEKIRKAKMLLKLTGEWHYDRN